MIPSRILFLLLSLAVPGMIQSCQEENKICLSLQTTSENAVDLKHDMDVLKIRLSKICGSCIVTESADSKRIQVCNRSNEDLLSEIVLITTHGKVEFLETFENAELYPILDSINLFLATTSFAQVADSHFRKTGTPGKEFEGFVRNNPLFAFLTPAVNNDDYGTASLRKGPVIGICKAVDTSVVNQLLNLRSTRAQFPSNVRLLWSKKPFDEEGKFYELIAVNDNPLNRRLSNKNIIAAKPHKSEYSHNWEVHMNFDDDAAGIWSEMTRENLGKSIAICIDDKVVSYPTVQGEITRGASVITGDFDMVEANRLSLILLSGELISDFEIKNDTTQKIY